MWQKNKGESVLLALVKIITTKQHRLSLILIVTAPHVFIINSNRSVLNYTGTNIWRLFDLKSLCICVMFMNEMYYTCFCAHYPCIIYQHMIVICTHLHKALSVCTYAVILCHIWFFLFYTCACVRFLPENNEKATHIIKLVQCVSVWGSVIDIIVLLLFSMREINLQAENSWVHCEILKGDEFMLNP